MIEQHQRRRISCQVDGKTFEGNYWIAGKILALSTSKGGTSTQLAHDQPDVLAEQLLLMLAAEGKA